MRLQSAVIGGKAESDRHVEIFERPHLAIEPHPGVGTKTIGPTEPGAQIANPEPLQPSYCIVEPVVVEMKPLADAQFRRAIRKAAGGAFRRAILPQ